MPVSREPGEAAPQPSDPRFVPVSFPSSASETALRTLVELAGDVAHIASFDWDLEAASLSWDDRLRRLIDVEPDAQLSLDLLSERIVPADLPAVRQATAQSIRQGTDLHVDLRVIDRQGATRRLTVSARPLRGESGRTGRLLGVVYDSSQVHDDREQAARALDTQPTAYALIDRDWTIRYVNTAARTLIRADAEPVGVPIWDVVPGLNNASVDHLLRGVMDDRESMTLELQSGAKPGLWFEISVQPVANGIAVMVNDVSARREAQAEATRAADRVALLARAGSTLVQRRPLSETLEAGLDLLVPQLAAAATIYLRTGPAGALELKSTRHRDPSIRDELHRVFAQLPVSADDPRTAVGRALLSGRSEIIDGIAPESFDALSPDPVVRERLLALREAGIIAVPMVNRGESIGLIGLLGPPGPLPEGSDLLLIEDIASRIAAAVDTAQILVQVQQARSTAELVTRRLEFLAAVTDALGSTLDGVEAARRLVRMLVPALATFATVILLDEDATVSHIFGAHENAAEQRTLERYANARLTSLTGRPALVDEVLQAFPAFFRRSAGEFASQIGDGDAAALLEALQPGHVTALPILSRDRPLGIITLYTSDERGPLNDLDLDATREIARRAGLVLDNARLYARSQSMAVTLQRSLLTEAVSQSDLAVETRYLPAVADAQIGGDWYDAFRSGASPAARADDPRAGATTLVIGDVMGHDTNAAALMGQLRTMVRTICVDRAEAPSAVLRRVDDAGQALGLDTTATAVVAEIVPLAESEAGPAGDPHAPRHRMRWSNAGHPPPVLLEAGGRARVLDTPADLLLGLGTDVPRADHELDLPPGATVLMFTDGLVEGRDLPIDLGLQRLLDTAGPLAHLPLAELCDELLAALVAPTGTEDDVALVAVRVLPITPPAALPVADA